MSALLLAALLFSPVAAAAQQQTSTSQDEQTDIWEWLKHRRGKDTTQSKADAEEARRKTDLLLVPIVASKPSTGFVFGAGASLEFPLGDVSETHVSSVLTGISFSTTKQFSVSARLALFGPGNRWVMIGDNHFQKTGQETFGFGTDTATADGVSARYNSVKFIDTYFRELPHDFFAGIGFQFQRQSNIRPLDEGDPSWGESSVVTYSEQSGFDLAAQTSAGVAVSLRHDSRDYVSDPTSGWYADATYRTHFADFLGGDSTWQRLLVDGRTYKGLDSAGRHKLAFWGFGDFVTGGRAPYFALPATGTDPQNRSGRGYGEGRFRGEKLVYGEFEYRWSLRRDGLVGMVAFLNATTVGSSFDDDRLFDTVALGAGFGFRLRLEKRSRTNICLDFGFGKNGSHGVYIALAEAF